MKIRLLLVITGILIIINCYKLQAQVGNIKGVVLDAVTNQPIPGASVIVDFSTLGTVTDRKGTFFLKKVPAGTQTITVSFIGFKARKMDVRVAAGKVTLITVLLKENVERLKEVEIDATRLRDTDVSVITDIKAEDQVATGMSGEQITRSQDVDAGQIIRRMGSVSLIDDKFVNIRGLPERYNSVMLNDVLTPSLEVDSRAFSYDIIPTTVLDRVMIYKTGGPEHPAEFAGGMVKLYTKDVPDENRIYFGTGFGLRVMSTFLKGFYYKGGTVDDLGFDDGARALPNQWPNPVPDEYHRSLKDGTKNLAFENNWRPDSGKFIKPDFRLNFGIAKNFKVRKSFIGCLATVNYSNINQFLNIHRYRYQPGKTDTLYSYLDYQSNNDVRVSIINNWAFVIDRKNKVEFRNIFNEYGKDEALGRRGHEYPNEPNYQNKSTEIKSLAYHYEQRGMFSSQLNGTHYFSDNWLLKWTGGYSVTARSEPDYRRASTSRSVYKGRDWTVNFDSIHPNINTASHFFSFMQEKVKTAALDLEHILNPYEEEEKQMKLKFGSYTEAKTRTYDARWFYYLPSRLKSAYNGQGFNTQLLDKPNIATIFSSENINDTLGLVVHEGTRPSDNYNCTNFLQAGYVSLYAPVNQWILSGGLRVEANNQVVNSYNITDGSAVKANLVKTNIFPSANVTYNLTERKLFRLAWFESINRPALRELASFSFYDYFYNINIVGNPNLQNCMISNFDFRYDYYPTREDIITAGLFYKYFRNPIERVIATDSLQFTYANATSAYTAGAEIEIRKSFKDLSNNEFLKNCAFVANGSLIMSQVSLGGANLTGLDYNNRALMGQAPWMFNGCFYYADEKSHTTFNLMYNVFGPRVYSVGNQNTPTQYELSRNSVDLNVNKYVSSHFEFRISLQDILNSPYRIWQDSNHDGKIDTSKDSPDRAISSYRRGQWFNFAVTYKL